MDFLYAGVLAFFLFYLSLSILHSRKKIKKIEEYHVPSSYDLLMLYRSYAIAIILIGFIIYFLFR